MNDAQRWNLGSGLKAHIELSFSPSSTLVPIVRRFVGEFYENVLGDPELTSRLVVATHELVENAVKFSVDGHTSVRIDVTDEERGTVLTVRTRNRSDLANIAVLQEMFAEISNAPDAFAHYQMLMRRTAKKKHGSGLGIGRIRAEAEMEMSLKAEGEIVELQAKTLLQPEKRA